MLPTTDSCGLPSVVMTGVAFIVGAACSMASGIIGMYISVKSNVRTAAAARRSLVEAVQVAMRGGAVSGLPRRRPVAPRRVRHLHRLRRLVGEPGYARRAVPHRRLRLRGLVRRAVRPARRRHLHQGRGRRLGPRRQGREGHPRGRSAQRRASSRTSSATTSATAPAAARTCSSHGRREHRRDDPRRRRLHHRRRPPAGRTPQAWIFFPLVVRAFGLLATIVAIFFVRGKEDREPDEHAQPRLLGHDDPVRGRRCAITTNVMMQTNGGTRANGAPGLGRTSSAPASSASRRASPSSTSPSSTRPAPTGRSARSPRRRRPARRRTSSRGTAVGFETTFVTAITIGIALFASHWLGVAGGPRRTPTATTSAASSGPPSRRWRCS